MSGPDQLGEQFLPSESEPVVYGEGKRPKTETEKELPDPASEPEVSE